VTVRERASGALRTLRAASVINCTGPSGAIVGAGSPLLDTLCAAGTVQPHPNGLGLHTASGGALIDARGREHETLFAIGPLRRGELWESTAVPEIRAQAAALARQLGRPRTLSALAG
jgi:uncharacterized NAD(P)/FAD-binding protein YdhS